MYHYGAKCEVMMIIVMIINAEKQIGMACLCSQVSGPPPHDVAPSSMNNLWQLGKFEILSQLPKKHLL